MRLSKLDGWSGIGFFSFFDKTSLFSFYLALTSLILYYICVAKTDEYRKIKDKSSEIGINTAKNIDLLYYIFLSIIIISVVLSVISIVKFKDET